MRKILRCTRHGKEDYEAQKCRKTFGTRGSPQTTLSEIKALPLNKLSDQLSGESNILLMQNVEKHIDISARALFDT